LFREGGQRKFRSSRSMAQHRCSIILVISRGAAKSGSGGGSASHLPSMRRIENNWT
jgi:hypothetical protein